MEISIYIKTEKDHTVLELLSCTVSKTVKPSHTRAKQEPCNQILERV